jgi:voltage-gated potassium channel
MDERRTISRDAWQLIVVAASVFAAIETPLRLALQYDVRGAILAADLAITVLFSIDLALHFVTPIRNAREVITDRREIALRYMKTWFVFDLLAAVPFDVLAIQIAPLVGAAAGSLRLLSLGRVLRLLHLAASMRRWQQERVFNPSLLRLGLFSVWTLMIAHWIACGWLALGGSEPEPEDSQAYLRAIYWTITTLASVGYGDITPRTNGQILFAMLTMLLGVAVYGYVIGNVASLLANIDVSKRAHQQRVEHVVVFMKNRGIPFGLQQRVVSYFNYLWESGMGQDEFSVLSDLPPSLRLELTLHLNRRIIQKVPLFGGASDAFVRDLVSGLRPVVYTPGDFVIRRGDVGHEMFFINRGRVEVLGHDDTEVVATLADGSFFGEMSLLSSAPRVASIRAVDYCELYSIDKETFTRVLAAYPEFARHIREAAEERTSGVGGDDGGLA